MKASPLPPPPPPLLSLALPPSALQKLSQEFEIKRLSLEEQRDRLQQQLDNLKEELSAKLNMANQEVRANDDEDGGDGDE